MSSSRTIRVCFRPPILPQLRRRYLSSLLILSLSGMTHNVHAIDKDWVCGSADWDNASCWSVPGQPTTGDSAFLIQNDASNRTVNYINTTDPGAHLDNFTIDATGSGHMIFQQSQDVLRADNQYIGVDGLGWVDMSGGDNQALQRYLGFGAGSGGRVNMSAGAMTGTTYVGYEGEGYFDQSVGSNTGHVLIGQTSTAEGQYVLSDASIIGSMDVGVAGIGTVNHISGYNIATDGRLHLGTERTGNGTYNFYSGTVSHDDGAWIGFAGRGEFNHYGGDHYFASPGSLIAQLFVGVQHGSYGVYNFHSGNLAGQGAEIGYSGTGMFNHYDGQFALMGGDSSNFGLRVGVNSSGNGTYNMSGGTIETLREYIGYEGTGVFNQSGGNNTIYVDGGNNYYGVYLGFNTSGNGTYNLSNGELNTYHLGAGRAGVGEFNQSGGSVDINENYGGPIPPGSGYEAEIGGQLRLGDQAGAQGTYNLSAGALDTRNTVVGVVGSGEFNQTGGTHTVQQAMTLEQNAGSSGVYNLSGGTLNATDIFLNTGAFNFTGGVLIVDTFTGNLVNNGGTLAPGNSPGTTRVIGDYTQLAGSYEVEIAGSGAGEYDVLDITGTATLGGSLDVSFFDDGSGLFSASAGDVFDVLVAETIVGEFDTFNLAMLDSGLQWSVSYLTDAVGTLDLVRLSVSSVPLPASAWLLASGLVGLITVSRRKRRKTEK